MYFRLLSHDQMDQYRIGIQLQNKLQKVIHFNISAIVQHTVWSENVRKRVSIIMTLVKFNITEYNPIKAILQYIFTLVDLDMNRNAFISSPVQMYEPNPIRGILIRLTSSFDLEV